VTRLPRPALPPGSLLVVVLSPLIDERAFAVLRDLRQRRVRTVVIDVLVPRSATSPPPSPLRWPVTTSTRGPTSIAVTAALLTGYLVLIDAPGPRTANPAAPRVLAGRDLARRVLVPAAVATFTIAAVSLAAALPGRLTGQRWWAPLGMASAATALLLTVTALRNRSRRAPGEQRARAHTATRHRTDHSTDAGPPVRKTRSRTG
jgi:hypothetical protein